MVFELKSQDTNNYLIKIFNFDVEKEPFSGKILQTTVLEQNNNLYVVVLMKHRINYIKLHDIWETEDSILKMINIKSKFNSKSFLFKKHQNECFVIFENGLGNFLILNMLISRDNDITVFKYVTENNFSLRRMITSIYDYFVMNSSKNLIIFVRQLIDCSHNQ